MQLTRLILSDFRLYEETQLQFSPGINVIYGNNAVGKTTILEAIYYLICGRSFRAKQPAELFRQGEHRFGLEAFFCKRTVDQKLKISYHGKERKIIHNRTLFPSATSLLGLLHGVIMTPDDVAIIKGAPAIRRRYLDMQLAQADPLYVHHLTRYYRAMKQRNTLLKSKQIAAVEMWEIEMAKSAAYLHLQRKKLIEDLQLLVKEFYLNIAQETVHLHIAYESNANKYDSSTEIANYYTDQYKRMRMKEMAIGTTLYGPHKDDMSIHIGDFDARSFASEGQLRCCVLAFRFAEWQRLSMHTGEHPLLLLDDIGTFLDAERKERLFASMNDFGQVFITSTSEIEIPKSEKQKLLIKL